MSVTTSGDVAATAPDTTDTPPTTDGRRARRDRNAEAVIDAVLGLLAEGQPFPSAQEVAQRSGVSLRSVFRYFDDLDAMAHAAITAFVERNLDAIVFPQPPAGLSLDERIDAWCRFRTDGLERTGVSQLAALDRARRHPALHDVIEQLRRQAAADAAELFRPELAVLEPADRERTAALVHGVTIVEVWHNLRQRLGLPADQVAEAFRQAVRGVLREARILRD